MQRIAVVCVAMALLACSRFDGIESRKTSVVASASAPTVASSAPAPLPPLDVRKLMAEAGGGKAGLRRIGEAFLRPDVDVVALTRAMQPRPEDYSMVFGEAVVKKAQAGYSGFWDKGSPIRPWPEHKSVRVHVATTEDFTAGTSAAQVFPQAYRAVAPSLKAGLRMFALRFESPKGARPLTYDGFVYVGGHWAYFPKPFRVIREAD